VHHRYDAQPQVQRELGYVVVSDLDSAVGREQHSQHECILFADAGPQPGEHAGRHSQVKGNCVGVTGAGTAPSEYQQVVLLASGHELFDKRQYDGATAIDDGLPPQLDDLRVWQWPEDRTAIRRALKAPAHQRFAHQGRTDV
jgi:hypothetical protein